MVFIIPFQPRTKHERKFTLHSANFLSPVPLHFAVLHFKLHIIRPAAHHILHVELHLIFAGYTYTITDMQGMAALRVVFPLIQP